MENCPFNTLANIVSLLGGKSDIVNLIRSTNCDNLSEYKLKQLNSYSSDLVDEVKQRLINVQGTKIKVIDSNHKCC